MSCIGALVRIPLGTVLGYIVILAAMFAGLSAVMVFAGADFCFHADSWLASDRFCAAMLGVFALAAFFGGFTAMRIGGGGAIFFLLLLFGSVGCLTALDLLGQADEIRFKDRPEERPDDLGPVQAAQWSETPKWCEWGNVGIGIAGIAVGAAAGKGSPREPKRSDSKRR